MVSQAGRDVGNQREGLTDEGMGRIDDRDVLSNLIQE
jgi:hypothetical protein